MELKRFSLSLFGFKRRQVADYILQQNELHTNQISQCEEKIEQLSQEAKKQSYYSYVLANEVKNLREANEQLTANCNTLEENLESVTKQRDSLEIEKVNLTEKNNILSMERSTLEQSQMALEQKLEIAENHLRHCQVDLLQTKSDLKTVALEYRNIQNQLKDKEFEGSIQRDVLIKCLSDIQSEKSSLKQELADNRNNGKSETEIKAENVRREIAEALSEIAKNIRDDFSDYGSNYVNIG